MMSASQNEKISISPHFDSTHAAGAAPAWPAVLVAMCSAFLVIVPMLIRGNPFNLDLQFHLSSWLETSRQWHQGTIYPHWAAWANYGLGEPRFIFYPPASWTLGAILGIVLPWKAVPGAFAWLALTLGGVTMHRLARESLGELESLWAAALYATNPYAILVIYTRSAFGELLAGALFPLVILAAIRLGRSPRRDIVYLAAGTAAMWLVNAPGAVITSYSVALLLSVRAIRERSAKQLILGASACALGLALAAAYIVPAAYEQRWVHIDAALRAHLRPEGNFLFARSLNPLHKQLNLLVSGLASAELAMFCAALFAARKVKVRSRGTLIFLATLGIAAGVLMLRPSVLLWRWLPWLHFAQFPWRVLFVLSLALVFSLVFATPSGWMGRAWRIGIVAAWVFLGGFLLHFTEWDPSRIANVVTAIQDGSGYRGAFEYAPLTADWDWLHPASIPDLDVRGPRAGPPGSVQVEAGSADTRVTVESSSAGDHQFSVDAVQPVRLPLKLLGYPAWRVEINDAPAALETLPHTGQIVVAVPAGHTRVHVHFARTPDRVVGLVISACAVAVALTLLMAGRRVRTG